MSPHKAETQTSFLKTKMQINPHKTRTQTSILKTGPLTKAAKVYNKDTDQLLQGWDPDPDESSLDGESEIQTQMSPLKFKPSQGQDPKLTLLKLYLIPRLTPVI